MSDPEASADNVRAMLSENLDRVRKASAAYFELLDRGVSSSQLPVTDQAKQFVSYMQRNVTATFELCDKLLHAKDVQETMRIQSEFFQDQMRSLTEQARGMSESVMKTATGVFTPKS
jgi:phasin